MAEPAKQPLKVLIGSCGSVASIKVPQIAAALATASVNGLDIEVRVVPTQRSLHFFDRAALPANIGVYVDEDEWEWSKIGDDVLHIELRKWADVFVVAPLDANTLGKLSNGLADNLLTCTARAWDPTEKPLIVCPAMNTHMWNHPITATQLDTLRSFGVYCIDPVSKTLACGDIGIGALASVEDITAEVLTALARA